MLLFYVGGGAGALLLLYAAARFFRPPPPPFDPDDSSRPVEKARKPVLYLYPEQTTDLRVTVAPAGRIVATYPAVEAGTWTVRAHPDGRLEHEDRAHRYLFWEATNANFTHDASPHVVARANALPFLEKLATAFELTDFEREDFITWWLPVLLDNEWSTVSLPPGYDSWAPLTIEPAPDTVIRLFILVSPANGPSTRAPLPLPTHRRTGFTVVEWGGAITTAGS